MVSFQIQKAREKVILSKDGLKEVVAVEGSIPLEEGRPAVTPLGRTEWVAVPLSQTLRWSAAVLGQNGERGIE